MPWPNNLKEFMGKDHGNFLAVHWAMQGAHDAGQGWTLKQGYIYHMLEERTLRADAYETGFEFAEQNFKRGN